ncbi:MAG: acyltransferase [Hyphomicrobiales bacterium]|nr:acyltransferase [Hyphomicrobiales bacterium]
MMTAFPLSVVQDCRSVMERFHCALLSGLWGMDLGEGCRVSLKARLDKTNPRGVHIGKHVSVARDAAILAHDSVEVRHLDTFIGERCAIGASAVIYPGVRIGDGCIIDAGAVVTRDIPPGSAVAGNPARIVEKNIRTGKFGVRLGGEKPVRPELPVAAAERSGEALQA